MRYCERCNRELIDEDFICPSCGSETVHSFAAPKTSYADYPAEDNNLRYAKISAFIIGLCFPLLSFFLCFFLYRKKSDVIGYMFWPAFVVTVLTVATAVLCLTIPIIIYIFSFLVRILVLI